MTDEQKTARTIHDTLNASIASAESALQAALTSGNADVSDAASDILHALKLMRDVRSQMKPKTGRAY